jgi:hypothetical protein
MSKRKRRRKAAARPVETESAVNPDLQELHDTLVATMSNLSDALGKAQDSDTVIRIVTEIDEVNHRVTLVGRLLFTQQTNRVSKAMDEVRAAESDVNTAIEQINDLTGFVKTITSFLALVDKVIDTAKLVFPVM